MEHSDYASMRGDKKANEIIVQNKKITRNKKDR